MNCVWIFEISHSHLKVSLCHQSLIFMPGFDLLAIPSTLPSNPNSLKRGIFDAYVRAFPETYSSTYYDYPIVYPTAEDDMILSVKRLGSDKYVPFSYLLILTESLSVEFVDPTALTISIRSLLSLSLYSGSQNYFLFFS